MNEKLNSVKIKQLKKLLFNISFIISINCKTIQTRTRFHLDSKLELKCKIEKLLHLEKKL